MASVWPKPTITTNTAAGKSSLYFNRVTVTDVDESYNITGWYSCMASNRYGTIFADFGILAYGKLSQ